MTIESILYNIYSLMPSIALLGLIIAFPIKKKRNKTVSESLSNASDEIFNLNGKFNLSLIIKEEYKKYIRGSHKVERILSGIGVLAYAGLVLLVNAVFWSERFSYLGIKKWLEISGTVIVTTVITVFVMTVMYYFMGIILFVSDYTMNTLRQIKDKSLSDFVTIAFLEIVMSLSNIFFDLKLKTYLWIRIVLFVTYFINYILLMIVMFMILKDPAKVAGNISDSENKEKSKKIYITTIILEMVAIVTNLYMLVLGTYWIQCFNAYNGLCGMKHVKRALFYYTVISFTTVGYGDITPVTPLSQFVSITISITSVVCLGTFVGKAFSYAKEMEKIKQQERIADGSNLNLLSGETLKTGIVITFTGSRGADIPLLYYSVNIFIDKGYDVERISCKCRSENEFEALYENVKNYIVSLNITDYEDVVFVGKSIGTVISCKLKEELGIPARLILYTPVEETLPYIRNDNDIIFVAAGAEDKHMPEDRIVSLCQQENIQYWIEKGVGHSMEISEDLPGSMRVIQNVIGKLQTLV